MEASNPIQDVVLNDSRGLSHWDNKDKNGIQFHFLFYGENMMVRFFKRSSFFFQKNCVVLETIRGISEILPQSKFRSANYHLKQFLRVSPILNDY